MLLAALARDHYGETDRGIKSDVYGQCYLPECESDGEFDLRVRELREIDLQLSGRLRNSVFLYGRTSFKRLRDCER